MEMWKGGRKGERAEGKGGKTEEERELERLLGDLMGNNG